MLKEGWSRVVWPVAIAVLLSGAIAVVQWQRSASREWIATANKLAVRPIAGRLAHDLAYRPAGKLPVKATLLLAMRRQEAEQRVRWTSTHASEAGRLAGAAALLAGRREEAFAIFRDSLDEGDGASLAALIQRSTDADLLTDFSAAALERSDDAETLLFAYEASDRAWRLSPTAAAGWNRALAIERIGLSAAAERAWTAVLNVESSPQWNYEAKQRRRNAAARAARAPDASLEIFYYRTLILQIVNGQPLTDGVPGDLLVADMRVALARLREPADHARAVAALRTYLRGRDFFEHNEYREAQRAYVAAESELAAMHLPVALIARDQRIRSECSQAQEGCLGAMCAFRSAVAKSGRYPWLAARSVYGEGQSLYRQGRIYGAAERLQAALDDFDRMGDRSSAAYMHTLLANVYAAGGESEPALRHHLEAIACRTPPITDRRRKVLEDAILFLLRHEHLAVVELLLDDLAASSTTNASNVTEAMLRGVVAFRRGEPAEAAKAFDRAHALLSTVDDEASRADVQFRLAIAEAGSRRVTSRPILEQLDTGIAAHEGSEYSIWLPQLLLERGAAHESRNHFAQAEGDYRRAIAVLEQREPRIDETVLALGLVTDGESPFDRLIRLLLREQRIAAALSIAQRASALRVSSLHARSEDVPDAYRRKSAETGIVGALQRILRPGQVAIAQHVLRDELITWVVDRESIRAFRRRVRLQALVSAARLNYEEASTQTLSDALLRDWVEGVPRGAELLIQPPAELEAVAFSALKTSSGEFLVQRNPIATAPSLSAFVLAAHNDRRRAGELSAFFAAAPDAGRAFAPLPFSATEVLSASRLYADSKLDVRATRARFLAHSASFRIVHFAGHIVVNAARPLFSALVLEGGDRLYVHELDERSFANARLVVLSGCESGRSPRPTMSIANALLSQGVPSVVYSLRRVDDRMAEQFGIAFHRAIAAGKSRAEAVQQAQLTLMNQESKDPGAWTAFALAGASGSLQERESERL